MERARPCLDSVRLDLVLNTHIWALAFVHWAAMLIFEQRPVIADSSARNGDEISLRVIARRQQAERDQCIKITRPSAMLERSHT
jgi:hypothetical protein